MDDSNSFDAQQKMNDRANEIKIEDQEGGKKESSNNRIREQSEVIEYLSINKQTIHKKNQKQNIDSGSSEADNVMKEIKETFSSITKSKKTYNG